MDPQYTIDSVASEMQRAICELTYDGPKSCAERIVAKYSVSARKTPRVWWQCTVCQMSFLPFGQCYNCLYGTLLTKPNDTNEMKMNKRHVLWLRLLDGYAPLNGYKMFNDDSDCG